ncbi:membrane protein insertase YidC [Ectothiorhodospiraceae bacterium 2226]|nr:membrane protein insertase YidC [Ectothiorhodospiraceae bacterium 2226]
MDIQRVLLFIALTFILLLIWQAWYDEQRATAPQPVPTEEAGPPAAGDVPERPRAEAAPDQDTVPTVAARGALPRAERVRVRTDVYDLTIDTVGGDIREVLLLEYPVSPREPDNPYRLMNDTGYWLFVAQNGLLPGAEGVTAPDHYAQFQAEQSQYTLAQGADTLQVPLRWEGDGVAVTKTYTFRRGSYLVDVDVRVENAGAEPWRGHFYRQLQRTEQVGEDTPWFIYTYSGGVISTAERRYEKISFSDMRDDLSLTTQGGWTAMIQHYFLGAWIPEQEQRNHFYTRTLNGARYVIGMVSPEAVVEPGGEHNFHSELFVGPKLQDQLREAAPHLELTVDYGFLTLLSNPLFWLLEKIYNLVGNWGWAIVILTVMIKLLFYKPSAISYRSMAKMRRVHPRLLALKERFGDDRQKLNQAMMDLYKTEKINPLAGCLPILIQIPVFIALYWVLLESVELRQADFVLWINDLSARDPFYVLPILMGLTMLVQQKLNPAPLDPIQAKVLMILPIVFTVFFAFFPAGLVLYWVVNNTISIAQQWYVTRHVVKA